MPSSSSSTSAGPAGASTVPGAGDVISAFLRNVNWAQVGVDLVFGLLLMFIGEIASMETGIDSGFAGTHAPFVRLLFTMVMLGAITLRSLAPGAALSLLWFGVFLQIGGSLDVAPLDLVILLVLYSCAVQPDLARVGMGWVTAFCAIPLATIYFLADASWVITVGISIWERPSISVIFFLFVVLCAIFISPVLIGTLVRALRISAADRAAREVAEVQTQRARELAQATVSREQIARDVHDMVGHSLAVIIAQAESMAYLPQDDPRYQQAGSNIAATAREALNEVRRIVDVAMQGSEQAGQTGQTALDGDADAGADADDYAGPQVQQLADAPDVIARLRDTGWTVQERSDGVPQPLAPEVSAAGAVALREVVTNVLKHGDREQPVTVRWVWDTVLCLHIENGVRPDNGPLTAGAPDAPDAPTTSIAAPPRIGKGLISMRERLAAVGGRFSAHTVEPNRYRASICVPLADPHASSRVGEE